MSMKQDKGRPKAKISQGKKFARFYSKATNPKSAVLKPLESGRAFIHRTHVGHFFEGIADYIHGDGGMLEAFSGIVGFIPPQLGHETFPVPARHELMMRFLDLLG